MGAGTTATLSTPEQEITGLRKFKYWLFDQEMADARLNALWATVYSTAIPAVLLGLLVLAGTFFTLSSVGSVLAFSALTTVFIVGAFLAIREQYRTIKATIDDYQPPKDTDALDVAANRGLNTAVNWIYLGVMALTFTAAFTVSGIFAGIFAAGLLAGYGCWLANHPRESAQIGAANSAHYGFAGPMVGLSDAYDFDKLADIENPEPDAKPLAIVTSLLTAALFVGSSVLYAPLNSFWHSLATAIPEALVVSLGAAAVMAATTYGIYKVMTSLLPRDAIAQAKADGRLAGKPVVGVGPDLLEEAAAAAQAGVESRTMEPLDGGGTQHPTTTFVGPAGSTVPMDELGPNGKRKPG